MTTSSKAKPPPIAIFDARMNFRHRSAISANASIRASISEISSAGSSSVIGLASVPTHPALRFRVERSSLQWQIVVLFRGYLDMLVAQHGEGPRDPAPGRMRHDDVIDIAALGRDEGRQEP